MTAPVMLGVESGPRLNPKALPQRPAEVSSFPARGGFGPLVVDTPIASLTCCNRTSAYNLVVMNL